MKFIVRLFSEITVKSPPVRKRMTRQLVENLRILLKRIDAKARVSQDWDRIDVEFPGTDAEVRREIAGVLTRVPGVAKVASIHESAFLSLDDVYEQAAAIWLERLAGKTFCVRVKRQGKHTFSSTDAERYIGGLLNQYSDAIGVKLDSPDVIVPIEIKDSHAYIVERYDKGLGGFPIGTQGEVLSLMSGGFDSTVASFLSIKRGLRTHYCFFNLGGKAHELGVKELAFYLWHRFGASHRVKFFTVPFDQVVAEILQKVDPSCMGVILKRMMLRAASQIAVRGQYEALVTGEAVAQVSSQTLINLSIIDRVTDALVIRPLAFSHKEEIIATAKAIGTESFSAEMPEYCGVISVRPSAKLRLDRVEVEEAKMNQELLDDALERTVVRLIDEVMEDVREGSEKVDRIATLVHNDIVIDIRHPDEKKGSLLEMDDLTSMHIPFYSLNKEFPKLDKLKRYLLYCDKGVMSELHASHLLAEGYRNVAVYRPDLAD